MLFCSCNEVVDLGVDEVTSDTDATQGATEHPTEKSTEKNTQKPSTNKNSGEKINGKTVEELFEAFIADYASATDLDIQIKINKNVNSDTPSREEYQILTSGDDFYLRQIGDGGSMQIWSVDGMLYAYTLDEKIKAEMGLEEYLGTDLIGALTASVPDKLDASYKSKLNAAIIHKTSSEYYVQVDLSAKEAAELGMEEVAVTQQILFDGDGRVTLIVSSYEDSAVYVIFNSYTTPVEVSAPENAEDFKQIDEKDTEAYSLYVEACELIANASIYSLELDVEAPDLQKIIFYKVNGEDKHLAVIKEKSYDRWIVDGVGYASSYSDPTRKYDIDANFLSPFEDVERTIYTCSTVIDLDAMAYVVMYENEKGHTTVEFELSDTNEHYVYEFNNDERTDIDVTYVCKDKNGKIIEALEFCFTDVNNENLNIEAPL